MSTPLKCNICKTRGPLFREDDPTNQLTDSITSRSYLPEPRTRRHPSPSASSQESALCSFCTKGVVLFRLLAELPDLISDEDFKHLLEAAQGACPSLQRAGTASTQTRPDEGRSLEVDNRGKSM